MRKKITLVLVILFSANVAIAGETLFSEGNNINAIVAGNSNFAFALYNKFKNDPNVLASKGNLFFSPYSISTVLAIAYGGARSQTKEQMMEALHFILPEQNLYSAFGVLQKQIIQADKSRGYQVFLANALWAQKGELFLKEFLDLSGNYYGAGLERLDFVNETEKSRQKINSWVEEKTKDKIKELIPFGGINQNTMLVLTNAIYFKGEWKTKFSWWKTHDSDFTVSTNLKVKVPLMHLKEKFKYVEDANLQAIELPYKSDEISMLALLPNTTDGLVEIENRLTTDVLNNLLSKMQVCEVDVYFPKFKMTWGTFCLNDTLKSLGMQDAFNPEKADFSGMTGKRDLWISDIFHQAFIEVNEKGTEAAAATAVTFAKAIFEPVVFRADHPFIFIIKDNRSGSILFMGRLTNPVE